MLTEVRVKTKSGEIEKLLENGVHKMNSEEFNTFYRRYYKVSVKIANGIVQSRFTAEDVTQEVFSYFYEIKERLDASSEEKLHALVVWKTTNKGRDYLRKSYVKREVMFDNDVAELQYRTTESAEAALLGLEKQKYLSMAFEGLRRKNLINYMIFMRVVMEGVSTEEVARNLAIQECKYVRVLRARKWLLQKF